MPTNPLYHVACVGHSLPAPALSTTSDHAWAPDCTFSNVMPKTPNGLFTRACWDAPVLAETENSFRANIAIIRSKPMNKDHPFRRPIQNVHLHLHTICSLVTSVHNLHSAVHNLHRAALHVLEQLKPCLMWCLRQSSRRNKTTCPSRPPNGDSFIKAQGFKAKL